MPAHNAVKNLKDANTSFSGNLSGNTYTQTFSTAVRTVPNATVAAVAGSVAVGAGTAGWDSDANRLVVTTTISEMKTSINALITDVLELKKVITALIDDLQTSGIVN